MALEFMYGKCYSVLCSQVTFHSVIGCYIQFHSFVSVCVQFYDFVLILLDFIFEYVNHLHDSEIKTIEKGHLKNFYPHTFSLFPFYQSSINHFHFLKFLVYSIFFKKIRYIGTYKYIQMCLCINMLCFIQPVFY